LGRLFPTVKVSGKKGSPTTTAMISTTENGAGLETKAALSVVVVYEDAAARECAVTFCDQLVSRFWAKCAFDVSWWPFALLNQAPATEEAAERAAQADLIVLSATPEGDFPLPVKAWVETWLNQRGDREGTLVGLMEPVAGAGDREGPKHHYLRKAAHRGSMDYLTQVPPDITRSIPDSLDSYTERADQVTSLLEDILHQPPPPPHLSP
jgi:hypothetical protein